MTKYKKIFNKTFFQSYLRLVCPEEAGKRQEPPDPLHKQDPYSNWIFSQTKNNSI